MTGTDKEALRQQMLLRALWGDARPGVVAGWLRDGSRAAPGLRAYRANAGALAERALAATYPTLQQLLGEPSFAALARAFWHHAPPQRGDIAEWGGGLPAFIADAESLAEEPYLADVARLEWAVHQAERAADAGPVQGIGLLAGHDPAALWLHMAPGTALVTSAYPVVTIWQAHRSDAADRFAPVRAAFARQAAPETAFIARTGWRVGVVAVADAPARFHAAVLAGRPLAQALFEAGDSFAFDAWLVHALQAQQLVAISVSPTPLLVETT